MNTNYSLAIGIPTYEGGLSLVRTLHSMYSQSDFEKVERVIVITDGKPLTSVIMNKIAHPKLHVIHAPVRQGQATRINDIFKAARTDYLFLTNDDVLIDSSFFSRVFTILQSCSDLYCCAVRPHRPRTYVEKSLQYRDEIVSYISGSFQNGVNYLRCNGRGIIVSRKFYTSTEIPRSLWNNDAYMYITAQRNKLKIEYAPSLLVKYKLPQGFKEYFRQHAKFAYSSREIEKYTKKSVSKYYTIPRLSVIKVYTKYFLMHPFVMTSYSVLYILASLRKGSYRPLSVGYWQTDVSTKQI